MSEITREQEVLLHLIQKNFRPDTQALPDEVLKAVDWAAVFKEAAQQAVLITAFDSAGTYKAHIPAEVYMQTFQRVSRGMMKNLQVNGAQKALTTLLAQNGYPYVILKGEAAAAYYPRPELRHLGDVDFLIDPAQKEEIAALLEQNGYTGSGHDHAVHVVFKKPGAHLEMHFDLPGVPNGQQGETVHRYVKNLLPTTGAGVQLCVPAAEHHGLILLLHMSHHMVSEGLGLRHLCDWAAFVDRTWKEDFWQDHLLPLLREIGLMKYAAVVTKAASLAMGTSCPDWARAEDDLCGAVLHDILTGGNFGRKDKERSKAGMMLSEREMNGVADSGLQSLIHKLHRSVERRHPIVQKIKPLYAVFDLYYGGLYLARSAMGKRPSLMKMAPLAQERRSIYEQLEIFETEE